jgi:hypothetical protein
VIQPAVGREGSRGDERSEGDGGRAENQWHPGAEQFSGGLIETEPANQGGEDPVEGGRPEHLAAVGKVHERVACRERNRLRSRIPDAPHVGIAVAVREDDACGRHDLLPGNRTHERRQGKDWQDETEFKTSPGSEI